MTTTSLFTLNTSLTPEIFLNELWDETPPSKPWNDETLSNSSSENTTNAFDPNYIPPEYLQMSSDTRNCVIAYIILFIIAATGNFSVFFSVLQQLRRTKSRISVLILHLSIADLLVTFGVIPLEIIWRITVQWYGGNVLCKICKFFHGFGLYLSSMVLICISMDRYFAIIHPLRVTDARRRGKLMLTSAWATAAICSLPQLLIFRVESHPKYPSFHQCISMNFFSTPAEELIYNLFSVSFMYFVPLVIVIFTYVMILCKISRKTRQHRESRKTSGELNGRIMLRRSDASHHMERAKSRTLRLTVVIVICFVLCWTPYVVMTLWYMLDRESALKVNKKIQDALFIMAVANSCLNPLVYGSYTRECRTSMTNCCGLSKCRQNDDGWRDGRRSGSGSGRGLRRQSQLKIKYTASKRSTASKSNSFRMGYSSGMPSPTIATLVEASPTPTPVGIHRFFPTSNPAYMPNRINSSLRKQRPSVKIILPPKTPSEHEPRPNPHQNGEKIIGSRAPGYPFITNGSHRGAPEETYVNGTPRGIQLHHYNLRNSTDTTTGNGNGTTLKMVNQQQLESESQFGTNFLAVNTAQV